MAKKRQLRSGYATMTWCVVARSEKARWSASTTPLCSRGRMRPPQIKAAVEALFSVKVLTVNTIVEGKTKKWKTLLHSPISESNRPSG